LLISGRKVGGVLPEAYWLGSNIKGIVLGIGLNISERSLPTEDLLSYPATYLEFHTQQEVNQAEMCKAILKGVIKWSNRLGTADFIKAWDSRLAYKGKPVQINLSNQETREGTLVGIANDGEILITFTDGSVGKYNSNELSLFPGA